MILQVCLTLSFLYPVLFCSHFLFSCVFNTIQLIHLSMMNSWLFPFKLLDTVKDIHGGKSPMNLWWFLDFSCNRQLKNVLLSREISPRFFKWIGATMKTTTLVIFFSISLTADWGSYPLICHLITSLNQNPSSLKLFGQLYSHHPSLYCVIILYILSHFPYPILTHWIIIIFLLCTAYV